MFIIDQNITAAKLREKNLVKVYFSMNNHEVATPEMMLEEARSYVMFCGEADAKVSAYIGIYLLQTGRRLFYAHSSNPFSPGERDSVEDEALCFVEGLGALVDEVNITKLSADEKSRWIDDQDIFSLEARPETSPEAPAPQPAEAEAAQAEPQAAQPSPAVPAETPQPQSPPAQPEPPAAPAPQTQPAPRPAEAEQTSPVEESTPQLSSQQPAVEADREYEVQTSPSPEDVPETRIAPKPRPSSKGTPPGEDAVSASERTSPKPAARATGSRAGSSAVSITGRQDIRQKTTKDESGKPPKPPMKKKAEDDTGVVRRDREALARLLSSF